MARQLRYLDRRHLAFEAAEHGSRVSERDRIARHEMHDTSLAASRRDALEALAEGLRGDFRPVHQGD